MFKSIIKFKIKIMKNELLLVTSTKVKLANKYNKILHFCPIFDGTYVALAIKSHRTQVISHIDNHGNIIKEKVFHDSDLQQMGMISDRIVIVLYPKQNLILQWNLQTNKYIQLPFLYKDEEDLGSCYLFLFPESRSFCVAQIGHSQSSLFRLSYFHYPILDQKLQPFIIFDDDQTWNAKHIIRKANNHSMVCWFETQENLQTKIKSFDFRENANGEYLIHELNKCQSESQQFNEMEISIGNLWQIRTNQLILVCITNENYDEEENIYPNNNFILNTKLHTMRRAYFTFPGKYQNQLIDTCYLGQQSMFRSYDYVKGVKQTTPIYYIDNQSEGIIAEEQWQCSHLSKYEFMAHVPNQLNECQYQNGHVEHVVVKIKFILGIKILCAFLMCQLIENCDEDLIYWTLQLVYPNEYACGGM